MVVLVHMLEISLVAQEEAQYSVVVVEGELLKDHHKLHCLVTHTVVAVAVELILELLEQEQVA
jgi:hypothetical protein